jgi:hypothetical protein
MEIKTQIVTTLITLFFTFSAHAQNSDVSCISAQDMQVIGQSFSQINSRLSDTLTRYCEIDLGKEWFAVSKSLEVLKNIKQNAPVFDEKDAFTHKAISEKNWWSYFTNRASSFTLERQCEEGVVAFVFGGFGGGNGNIHLCPFFFEQGLYSQASVMMHEVRHFDGHRHVTCASGQEEGNRGACDTRLSNKGSYAISVQTIVGMARSNDTPKDQASLLESEALYMAFNKFNETPEVKINNAVILSNNAGEVLKWNPLKKTIIKVGQLNESAVVLNSYNRFTIYPTDANVPAYRMDKELRVRQDSIGLFAVEFNKETPAEKEKYKNISYLGAGGLLKENTLITICDNKTLFKENLNKRGEFVAMISMSEDDFDQERTTLLLSTKGDIISYECRDSDSNNLVFKNTGLKFSGNASDVVESFSLDGNQYAVLKNGTLVNLNLSGSTLSAEQLDLPVNNKDWVSATPLSNPVIFN